MGIYMRNVPREEQIHVTTYVKYVFPTQANIHESFVNAKHTLFALALYNTAR